MPVSFIKMHGAGNDFVILDGRKEPVHLTPAQLQGVAARRTGVGCDQVIVMEFSQQADIFMRIYNADASEVASCGNATRCVAWLVMEENGKDTVTVETKAGLLTCLRVGQERIRVDMGEPHFGWQAIPLAKECDTLHLGISLGNVADPVAVSMGNPHMVFAVANMDAVEVAVLGQELEHHALFPERANVSFAQVLDKAKVKLRVWERGAGETLACGTAACATLVALNRRGLVADKAEIELPGGALTIEWDKKTNHVWMTGPVAVSFSGLL